MPNYEATLEISHDCPYCIVTRDRPGTRINLWSNERMHVAVFEAEDDEDLMSAFKDFKHHMPCSYCSHRGGRMEIIYDTAEVESCSVPDIIAQSDCWYSQPQIVEKGSENYRVYSWSKENISKLVENIRANGGEVRLVSLKAMRTEDFGRHMTMPSEKVLDGLSDKQVEIIVTAYQLGYFDQPARISADDLAKRLGISRSTLTEHLRKAETRLIGNVFPVLRLACKCPYTQGEDCKDCD